MNRDIRVNPSEEPLPELAVLARLPRVGGITAKQEPCPPTSRLPGAFTHEPSDNGSPLLVLLEDDAPAPQPPLADRPPSEQAAVAALSEIAKPGASHEAGSVEFPSCASEEIDVEEPERTRVAGSVFRIHEWIAPYSSVVVTVALVAIAGLLFFVASQPQTARENPASTWAEDRGVAAPWSPNVQPAPENQVVAAPESKPGERPADVPAPDFSTDDVRDLAPQVPNSLAAADPSEITPTELPETNAPPEVVLGSPQPYPTTGSPAFQQALAPTGEKQQ